MWIVDTRLTSQTVAAICDKKGVNVESDQALHVVIKPDARSASCATPLCLYAMMLRTLRSPTQGPRTGSQAHPAASPTKDIVDARTRSMTTIMQNVTPRRRTVQSALSEVWFGDWSEASSTYG